MPNRSGSAMRPLPSLLVVFIALAAGCGRTETPSATAVSDAQFVEVVVALREAAAESGSPEAFEARRTEILTDAGVTEEMLVDFVQVRGRDVPAMRSLWDSVALRRRALHQTDEPE